MANQLIRGYTNCGFEAWTVPCLYVAGKYMRIFAIKADEATGNNTGAITTFQDDFNPEAEKNEKLEDAARQLNRIFQICLADRFAMLKNCRMTFTDSFLEHHLRTRENGASTTSSICCSRPTSN
jgi:hypothetical protein